MKPHHIVHFLSLVEVIHQWVFLLPEDQRESLDTGCNRLTVTQDFYFQAIWWRHTSRLKND
jgi:hypothetical protein